MLHNRCRCYRLCSTSSFVRHLPEGVSRPVSALVDRGSAGAFMTCWAEATHAKPAAKGSVKGKGASTSKPKKKPSTKAGSNSGSKPAKKKTTTKRGKR